MGQPTELATLIESFKSKYDSRGQLHENIIDYLTAAYNAGLRNGVGTACECKPAPGGLMIVPPQGCLVHGRSRDEIATLVAAHGEQIASLQMAVAAIERRQMPLLSSTDAEKLQRCRTALHELANDCDKAASKLAAWADDPAFMVSRGEVKDLSVSLGDSAALASKTAREAT